jgi:mono/diheme cytochrome c family protein
MKTFWKWLRRVLVGLAVIVVIAVTVIYVGGEFALNKSYAFTLEEITVPSGAEAIAAGEHIFQTRACEGCHGEGVIGELMFEAPFIGRVVAPNLTQVLPSYSDAQLATLLHQGVRPDGTGVIIMPSSVYYFLADEDIGNLIAYLRTLERVENELPDTRIEIMARLFFLLGEFQAEPDLIPDEPRMEKPAVGPTAEFGAYIAQGLCAACHGQDLHGRESEGAPDLQVMALAYGPEAFHALLREGIRQGIEEDEKGTMKGMSEDAFRHFTDDEITAIYAHLKTLTPKVDSGEADSESDGGSDEG